MYTDVAVEMSNFYNLLLFVGDIFEKNIIMILNHFALTVTDVYKAREFLEKYFELKGIGENNHKMTHVMDDNGTILSLFKGASDKISTPKSTHIGFMQESEKAVYEIYERLIKDSFEVAPPKHGHGLSFVIVAPGGFAVEIVY